MNPYQSPIQEATRIELNPNPHFEQQVSTQFNEERGLFYEGEFDGSLGIDPRYPENPAYWQGYQKELKEYWVKHLSAS